MQPPARGKKGASRANWPRHAIGAMLEKQKWIGRLQRKAVKSAMRTFEVLELFAEQRRPLSLQEIYTALGYPQSSTTNLLKSMLLMGYLNYNRRQRVYLPTMRLNMLGSWVAGYIHAEGGFRELVDEMQRRTDETVGLSTQNDLFIQYLFMKTPDHEFKNAPPDGTMRLLVDSSGGLAMMSRMSDRAIDKLCRYTNYYEMGSERISTEAVMRDIAWIRHVGYAYAPNRPFPEVSSISIALDADLHGIPLAIGVGGLAHRINPRKDEIVRIMRELIAEFTARHPTDDPSEPAEAVREDSDQEPVSAAL
jgi:DNA-binding IclR family transcriptional regulator